MAFGGKTIVSISGLSFFGAGGVFLGKEFGGAAGVEAEVEGSIGGGGGVLATVF